MLMLLSLCWMCNQLHLISSKCCVSIVFMACFWLTQSDQSIMFCSAHRFEQKKRKENSYLPLTRRFVFSTVLPFWYHYCSRVVSDTAYEPGQETEWKVSGEEKLHSNLWESDQP